METLQGHDIRAVVERLKALMNERKAELIALDSAMGDGDLGLSMAAAFTKAAEELAGVEEKGVGKLLLKAGTAIARGAPSTMGTLIATGFMRAGKALGDKSEAGLADVSALVTAFAQGVAERGKAKPGDKTILDALYPAAKALEAAVAEKLSLGEGFARACEAAARGVEETKGMKAQHGRAAYYGEKSIGKRDPGATVGLYILQAFSDQVR
jgi:dihydroxyacetone kinase-like protein